MKTHLKLFYIFFSKHVEYHTPVEILSRVQFCTVFVHVSTSQRVNKNCTKLKFFFLMMLLYSSFVMNTLKKFPGAATVYIYHSTSPKHLASIYIKSLYKLVWVCYVTNLDYINILKGSVMNMYG
jgi:hypothetical protein